MFCIRIICACLALCQLARVTYADYTCLCNYQVETPMFKVQDTSTSPAGYLYEFDCKPLTTTNGQTAGWYAVMNEQAIAFVQKGDGLNEQVCQGTVPSEDKVTMVPVTSTTSTMKPIVTTTATRTTTDRPITSQPKQTTKLSSTMTSKPTTVISTTKTTTAATTTTTTTTQAPTTKTTTKPTQAQTTTRTTTTTTIKPTQAPTTKTTTKPTQAPTTNPTQTTTTTPKPTQAPTTKPTQAQTTTTTTTTTKAAALALLALTSNTSVTDEGNLSFCPTPLTTMTDARWIRQYKNFCYEIVANTYKDWYDALEDCEKRHGFHGGTLLEIYTPDIQNYIMQFLQDEAYNHPVWIGLEDVDREEHFDHWITDIPLQYENFDPNRKDNFAPHSKEDCVLLETSGLWDDAVCNENDADDVADDGGRRPIFRHSYICQYPTVNRPTTTLPTTTSSVSFPTATNIITDLTGNVQLCPDAIRQSTDANMVRQYKQYCYELVPRYEDWYEANQDCRSRSSIVQGRLIEIYTPDIQQFITQVLSNEDYKHPVWIGLQDVDKEETFDHWETDTPLTYANFDPNRKNNYANHAQENCVLLEPSGYWDDSVCDDSEANQAEQDGHPGLLFRHSWICQYPIQQPAIVG